MSSELTFEPPRTSERFSTSDRVQHAVMLVSFLVLTVTGLPQKYIYANNRYLDDLIELMGGLETVRVVHRWAAYTRRQVPPRILITCLYSTILRLEMQGQDGKIFHALLPRP